jgi:ABC-2 type transport system ATP-binding protein
VQGVEVGDILLRRPTLDDVFLALTGHVAEEVAAPTDEPKRGRGRK